MAVAAAGEVVDGGIDVRSIGRVLWRRRRWIVAPSAAVLVLATIGVNIVAPRYKSEARVLYEGRENVFLRPEADKTTSDQVIGDQEAIANQVQVVLSRQVALDVISQIKLAERPEFDPLLDGISPLRYLLIFFGLARNPFLMTPEERVLQAYYDRLSAFSIDKSRVVVIEFQSADTELAARAANAVAESYIARQQAAKQEQTRGAGEWLAREIEKLRARVADAEAKVEIFRAKTNLFVGTNNTMLSNQQLGEFNSQLNSARAQRADAETRARLIRDMLRRGEPIEAADIMNSELIRRLSEQRVTLRAQLAEQSSTLLGGHPRIKELKAQINDLDGQIRAEAEKVVRTLENDAKIAGARVETLTANLEASKRQAASTNEQDVQLRALEREAKSQRDLLESYLAKYREATARETIGSAPPADARIISRAIVSNTPYFPKKMPIVLIATLTVLALASGLVLTGELLGAEAGEAPPVAPVGRSARAESSHPALGVPIGVVSEAAHKLRASSDLGRCVAVFDRTRPPGASLAALTLARALAGEARTVLVDLTPASAALVGCSSELGAPGISDVARGAASFRDVIGRDKLSRLHVVGAGSSPVDAAAVAAPALRIAMEALARSYQHVIIDASAVAEPADIAAFAPRAMLVAPQDRREMHLARERLARFADIMLVPAEGDAKLAA